LRIERFFSQPFIIAGQFMGKKGICVKLEDTLKSFAEIVGGKADDLPNSESPNYGIAPHSGHLSGEARKS
jgi:F0F1-type ATP synthase beta subunit